MRPRVWSPLAKQVEVSARGARFPLTPTSGGYWEAALELAEGERYSFSIDGGPLTPDPRSRLQPDGVHAASEVTPRQFTWTDAAFIPTRLAEAVIYELHIGTFSPEGTFDGVVKRLSHLLTLGVTHVEVMPVCEFPGDRGWGYDGVYPFAVHHAYGGAAGLKRLVNECHRLGIAVLLDVVYNHLGPSGNYLSRFGPYFTEAHQTPWGAAVNLDQADSDEVRRYFCDNALMWLSEFHIDGLRLDAVHALHDDGAYHLLEQLSDEVAALSHNLGKPLVLIAESDRADPRTIRPVAEGGLGMNAQWCDDLHHAIHVQLTGEKRGYYADYGGVSAIVEALRHGFAFRNHFSNHRQRRHGHPRAKVPLDQLIVSLQNHDQIGNRAQGERIGHLVSTDQLKLASALVLWSPCVPQIFQGEEWNTSSPFLYFTNHLDPELGRLVREGRRREFAAFGWLPEDIPDPQAEETFLRSKLDWAELQQEPHRGILDWYRLLLRARREHQAYCHREGLAISSVLVEVDEGLGRLSLRRGPFELHVDFVKGTVELRGLSESFHVNTK